MLRKEGRKRACIGTSYLYDRARQTCSRSSKSGTSHLLSYYLVDCTNTVEAPLRVLLRDPNSRHQMQRTINNVFSKGTTFTETPHLNSAMVCTVVGTSNRRTSSVAACTDHAKRDGMPCILLIAAGEGPTVLTEILLLAMANACGCVSSSNERLTATGLSSGSPIPMYTALVREGC